MKYLFHIIFLILLTACGKSEEKSEPIQNETSQIELGKQLFEGAGNCVACHKPNAKIIGPSITEIATIYKDKSGNIVEFLKGNREPIVDPDKFEIMKTNFAITKNMSNEQLQAISDYMQSHIK